MFAFSPPNVSDAGRHAVPVPLVLWQDETSLNKAASFNDALLVPTCSSRATTTATAAIDHTAIVREQAVWRPSRRALPVKN